MSIQAACFPRGTEPGKRSNVASDVWIYGDLSKHHAFFVLLPVKINKGSVRNSNIKVMCKYYAITFRDSPYFGHNVINHLFATNSYSCGYLEINVSIQVLPEHSSHLHINLLGKLQEGLLKKPAP